MEDTGPKVSPRYEFDAPQFYDFSEGAPASPEQADKWFNERVPSPASATTHSEQLVIVADPAKSTVSGHSEPSRDEEVDKAGVGKAAVHAKAGNAAHPLRKIVKGIGNIVTSWGAPAARVPTDQQSSLGEVADAAVKNPTVAALSLPKREGFITPRRPKPTKQPTESVQEGPAALNFGVGVFNLDNHPDLSSTNVEGVQDPGNDAARNTKRQNRAAEPKDQQTSQRAGGPAVSHRAPPPLKLGSILPPGQSRPRPSQSQQLAESEQRPAKRSKYTPTASGAPDLATSARARPPRYKSREQMEEEEMAAMPQFKARPYSGGTRAQQVTPIWERPAAAKATKEEEPSNTAGFKAQPLDTRILKGPTFTPTLEANARTTPQSPCLATSGRSRSQPKLSSSEASQEKARMREWQSGVLTEVKPFNLDTDHRSEVAKATRGDSRKRKLEEAEEVIEFKAQPVPLSHYHVPTTHTNTAVLTMPEPFSLESERRHREAQDLKEMLNQQVEERERKERNFKARPVPKRQSKLPPCPEKLLTIPQPFALPGDLRSLDRAAYDAEMHEKDLQRQAAEEAEAARRQEEDAQELAKLRESLQFKARPMPKYPSQGQVGFQPPPLKWTEPTSPQLETAKRSRQRR